MTTYWPSFAPSAENTIGDFLEPATADAMGQIGVDDLQIVADEVVRVVDRGEAAVQSRQLGPNRLTQVFAELGGVGTGRGLGGGSIHEGSAQSRTAADDAGAAGGYQLAERFEVCDRRDQPGIDQQSRQAIGRGRRRELGKISC